MTDQDGKARSICGVIIVTPDVERLARYYSALLDLPVVREEHGNLPAHYGVNIGATHLGIHPPESFGRTSAQAGGTVIAIEVDNLEHWLDRLEGHGELPALPKRDEGFGLMATFKDPDGNLLELVELNYDFGSP